MTSLTQTSTSTPPALLWNTEDFGTYMATRLPGAARHLQYALESDDFTVPAILHLVALMMESKALTLPEGIAFHADEEGALFVLWNTEEEDPTICLRQYHDLKDLTVADAIVRQITKLIAVSN